MLNNSEINEEEPAAMSDPENDPSDKPTSSAIPENKETEQEKYDKILHTNNQLLFSSSVQSTLVHAFYYPWYGSLEHDNQWRHWNHETIPHWRPEVNKRYPQYKHNPPEDVGANFYPLLGPYSSKDQHVSIIPVLAYSVGHSRAYEVL